MAAQDTSEIKERILRFLKSNGPSLPVQISREIKMDSLFASAFLSELLSQNKLKITKMKVGGSPLYYLEETKDQLAKHAEEYLKSKEKEAFLLLQEKEQLIDSQQETAIRVALRALVDFAKPIEKEGNLVWEYYIVKEKKLKEEKIAPNIPNSIFSEVRKELERIDEEPKKEIQQPKEEEEFEKIEEKVEEKEVEEKKEEIGEEVEEKKIKPKKEKPISKKKNALSQKTKPKAQDKKNERFFNIIKEYLTNKDLIITDIIGFKKEDLTLKIKKDGEEKLLIAYNKKKLTELDITNAYKKAKEFDLKYIIFTLGDPAKKTTTFIEAIRNLSSIEKIE